jgi:hypothetical protein
MRMVFPSSWYEQENAADGYQPETVAVSQTISEDLSRGEMTHELERLIRQAVVLGVPKRYFRQDER